MAYAYRQLARALHPDKNPSIPTAAAAFKRLSEAAEELRQGAEGPVEPAFMACCYHLLHLT